MNRSDAALESTTESRMLATMTRAHTVTIPLQGTTHSLEGRLHRVDGAHGLAVVAPPHPLHGGTLGNPVVHALERALGSAGYATLAFNFRGTGESSGTPSAEFDDALVDYGAAADAAVTGDLVPGCFAGYSFGSIAALAAAVERSVPKVLMVAPPLGLLDPALPARYRGRLVIAVGDLDEYAPVASVHERFAACANTEVVVLEGADHFFLGSGANELSRTLTQFLAGEQSR